MHVLQKAEFFVALIKSDSTTGTLPAVLKILGTSMGNVCGGVSFRYCYVYVDRTALSFQTKRY